MFDNYNTTIRKISIRANVTTKAKNIQKMKQIIK